MENLAFHSLLTQMKDDYTTNSHYITYTFSLYEVGRMYFLDLGVKGLTFLSSAIVRNATYCSPVSHRIQIWRQLEFMTS